LALEELEGVLSGPDTAETAMEAGELAGLIEGFLDTLSAENRVIFLRRYWFSDPYGEIARWVGVSEKSVSVRLTRLRRKLKDYLTEREVIL
jgi:RNA polymerase sigma-70 factor (ECF subfamily)